MRNVVLWSGFLVVLWGGCMFYGVIVSSVVWFFGCFLGWLYVLWCDCLFCGVALYGDVVVCLVSGA